MYLSDRSLKGRYLPVFASEIYDQNIIAQQEGRATLNLQSVIIGNGNTGISTLVALIIYMLRIVLINIVTTSVCTQDDTK